MVVGDIKLMEMIIKGKRKYTDRPVRTKVPPCFYIAQVMDAVVIDNAGKIVKME